jgi:hypothetical protein
MPDEVQEQDLVPFPVNSGDSAESEVVEDTPEDGASAEAKEEKMVSQAELDRILQKRLKRQEETLSKKYADYEQLKEDADQFRKLQDEKSTDSERWEREKNGLMASLQEKETELTKLQRAALVTDLATEKGLPKSFWKRVSGDSPEEIEEDINSIIDDLGITKDTGKETPSKKPAKRTVYGGGGENETPDPDIEQLVSKIPRGPQFRIDKPRTYK